MQIRGLGIAAALSALLVAGTNSQAATVYDVTIWTGSPVGNVASSTIADTADTPSGTPTAHFTYTGDINWLEPGPQNTDSSGNLFGTFFGGTVADISGFTSPSTTYGSEADFLAASMSVAGDAYASFFQILGSYSGSPVTGSISHDDGATVYDDLGNAVYLSPAETSDITGNFTLPGGAHPFTVDYVEGNGSPSVLDFSVNAVPEPAIWAMMLIGFFGVGTMMRRSRNMQAFATA